MLEKLGQTFFVCIIRLLQGVALWGRKEKEKEKRKGEKREEKQ